MDPTVEFSAINSLRTGNMILDMGIAMVVPATLRTLYDSGTWSKFARRWRRRKGVQGWSTRTIAVHTKGVGGGNFGSYFFEQKNAVLQKALKLYITKKSQVEFKEKAQVQLTAMYDTTTHRSPVDKHNPLADYQLTWIAADNEWAEVLPGLHFRQFTETQGANGNGGNGGNGGGNDKLEQYMIYELSALQPDGAKKIDDFIETALEWYESELEKQREDKRWLYAMVNGEAYSKRKKGADGQSDESAPFVYKRYELSDAKTFDSLFFPEKDNLMRLLHDFEERQGKYAVRGFPHKLGLLLHGPPGTGKTSLIKSLAHHTGRSIINVALSQIETNQQLFDLMYDLQLPVVGADASARLSFKDVIFVIEDVDACSSIVRRRDGAKAGASASASSQSSVGGDDASADAARFSSPSPSGSDDERATHATLGAARPHPVMGPTCSELPGRRGPRPPPDSGVGIGAVAVAGPLAPGEKSSYTSVSGGSWSYRWEPDALNLAGLLNVLDGVVDTPGRLLVMTSNHPEQLDPALIRPGRIDRCLRLGYLKADEAAQMLAHNFAKEGVRSGEAPPPLEAAQRERLGALLAKRRAPLTPAALEQMCAEHVTVDSLLDGLESGNQLSGSHSFDEPMRGDSDATAAKRQRSASSAVEAAEGAAAA